MTQENSLRKANTCDSSINEVRGLSYAQRTLRRAPATVGDELITDANRTATPAVIAPIKRF